MYVFVTPYALRDKKYDADEYSFFLIDKSPKT